MRLLFGLILFAVATVTIVNGDRIDFLRFDPDTDYIENAGNPSGSHVNALLAEDGRILRFTTSNALALAATDSLVECAEAVDFACTALGADATEAMWFEDGCLGRCDQNIRVKVEAEQ